MKKLSFLLFSLLILTVLSTQNALADKPPALDNKHNSPSSSFSLLKKTSTGIHGLEKAKKRPDGTLVVTGKLSGNGTIPARHIITKGLVSPGNSPGCLGIGGNWALASSTTLGIEIAGLIPCSEHDQIHLLEDTTGTLTINNATLIIALSGIGSAPVYEPALDDTFKIIDFDNIIGTFGTIDTSGAVLPEPLTWDTSWLYLTGELIVRVPQPAGGDLAPWNDPDGLINAADILIAEQLTLGLRTAGALQYAHGDMNNDDTIDLTDLILIRQLVF